MPIDFEASSSQSVVMAASAPQAQNRGAISIFAWWRPESLVTANLCGFSTNNGGVPTSNTRANLKTNSDGSFGGQMRAPDSGSLVSGNTAINELVTNEWYQVGVAYNVAADQLKIIRDGATVATPAQSYTNAATDNTVSASGAVCAEENGGSAYNDGKIDDVLVFDRQLTDAEASCIYNSQGASMVHRGLLSWWRMLGPRGGTVGAVKDRGRTQANLSAGTNAPIYAEGIIRRRRAL